MGIECRDTDENTLSLINSLNDTPTHTRVTAERAFNHRLEGGCQVPIAAFAMLMDDQIWLRGLVAIVDGRKLLFAQSHGPQQNAEKQGLKLAEELLGRGADRNYRLLRL